MANSYTERIGGGFQAERELSGEERWSHHTMRRKQDGHNGNEINESRGGTQIKTMS